MSAYIVLSRLNAVMPPQFRVEALDDDKDGAADAGLFDEILSSVQDEIDGILGQRYAVPFSNPIPAIVADAATKLTAERLYLRRNFKDEKNPWSKPAADIRAALAEIAAGKRPLAPELGRKQPSASIVSEPAKTYSESGLTAL